MKFFVTGVGGQLGHDVMNELSSRGHEGVGSDIAPSYSGIADGTPVTTMPYVQLDITDKEAVAKAIREVNPDAVVHCAAWTAVDAAEDEENREKVRLVNVVGTQNIADICKELGIKMMYISTDYVLTAREPLHGIRTAKTTLPRMYTVRPSLTASWQYPALLINSLSYVLPGYSAKTVRTLSAPW